MPLALHIIELLFRFVYAVVGVGCIYAQYSCTQRDPPPRPEQRSLTLPRFGILRAYATYWNLRSQHDRTPNKENQTITPASTLQKKT